MTPFILRFAEPLAPVDSQSNRENSNFGQRQESPEVQPPRSGEFTRITKVNAETTDDA